MMTWSLRGGLRWALAAGLIGGSTLVGPLCAAQDVAGRPSGLVTAPHEDFRRAGELFRQGQRDEAVFWYYRARLRARVHLEARPELTSRGDSALLASMSVSVGERIAEWALDDIPMLTATIERVLTWHDRNDDPFTPKASFSAAHAKARLWLAELLIETQLGRDRERLARLRAGLIGAAR